MAMTAEMKGKSFNCEHSFTFCIFSSVYCLFSGERMMRFVALFTNSHFVYRGPWRMLYGLRWFMLQLKWNITAKDNSFENDYSCTVNRFSSLSKKKKKVWSIHHTDAREWTSWALSLLILLLADTGGIQQPCTGKSSLTKRGTAPQRPQDSVGSKLQS